AEECHDKGGSPAKDAEAHGGVLKTRLTVKRVQPACRYVREVLLNSRPWRYSSSSRLLFRTALERQRSINNCSTTPRKARPPQTLFRMVGPSMARATASSLPRRSTKLKPA